MNHTSNAIWNCESSQKKRKQNQKLKCAIKKQYFI